MKNNNWTFGIIFGNNPIFLNEVIESIEIQNIPNYEIILLGDLSFVSNINKSNIKKVHFNESVRPLWITKKKNIIANLAKYDNISLHHDYVKLHKNWYPEFLQFENEWDVCMTRIENKNGNRFRDWVTWDPVEFVDYKDNSKIKNMYVSGTYFCIKKDFFIANPLDENLIWGWGEDVEWSKRIRDHWNYKCNWKSKVLFCKQKEPHPAEDSDISKDWYDKLYK
jgi:hypothetical protein